MADKNPVVEAVPPGRRQALADLYEPDETAWLEESSRLIRAGRLDELDYANLACYLEDMAIRDRREVNSRLRTLLAHLLKWRYQPAMRTGSWKATIIEQQAELEDLLQSGTLHRHAEEALSKVYAKAVKAAAGETGLPAKAFPADCPFTLEQVLAEELA